MGCWVLFGAFWHACFTKLESIIISTKLIDNTLMQAIISIWTIEWIISMKDLRLSYNFWGTVGGDHKLGVPNHIYVIEIDYCQTVLKTRLLSSWFCRIYYCYFLKVESWELPECWIHLNSLRDTFIPILYFHTVCKRIHWFKIRSESGNFTCEQCFLCELFSGVLYFLACIQVKKK